MLEDLNSLDKQKAEDLWAARRERMAQRRVQFETLWRTGVTQFFAGILATDQATQTKHLYNPIYEQYDSTLFSREGFRFLNAKYPMMHAVIMRKLAIEIVNKPKPHWLALGSNDQSKPIAFSHVFNQVLYDMDSDSEDFEVFMDKGIFGTGAVLQITEEYEANVKDFNIEEYGETTDAGENEKQEADKASKSTKKKIKTVRYKRIDLRHLYLDEHCQKTNLSDCNYAMIDEFYSVEDLVQRYPKREKEILLASTNKATDTTFQPFSDWTDNGSVSFVTLTHCWDKISDTYHQLLNGKIINDLGSPIPRKPGKRGKSIPITLAVDYKIPGAPYGYGEAHVTSGFNQIKNLARQMIVEITEKMAKPLLAVDPLSNFDEQGFEWGTDFVRVSPKDITQININPNLELIYKMDAMTDNDVIRATGINFNDTTNTDVNETARKTVIRRESQNAIVELGMRFMTMTYFKPLYTLLKDDILLHYPAMIAEAGGEVDIKTNDVRVIRGEDGLQEIPAEGGHYFKVRQEDIDMDFDMDLEMCNIASSKELEKALSGEAMDWALKVPMGYDPNGLAKWGKELYDMPDYVLAASADPTAGKTPEQIATEGIDPSMLPDAIKMKMQMQQNQAAAQQPVTPQPNASKAQAPIQALPVV